MELFQFLFGAYVIGAFICSFYFWGTRTHKNDDPFTRRLKAAGWGIIWPYAIYLQRKEAQQIAERQSARQTKSRSILDGLPGERTNTPPPAQPPVQGSRNPFDEPDT